MHNALKLLAGIAATLVVTRAGGMVQGQVIVAKLSGVVADALIAEGVTDGSLNFHAPDAGIGCVALVSGSADSATRTRVLTRIRQHPGISDAIWIERPEIKT